MKKITRFAAPFVLAGLLFIPTNANATSNGYQYEVKQGDTLWSISRTVQASIDTLRSLNQLKNDTIFPGQILQYKESTVYTVKSGDTLFLIGKAYGVSADTIMQANNLTHATIYAGQTLVIPKADPAPAVSKQADPVSGTYTVQTGDTLWLLSQRFNKSVSELRLINNLNSDVLQVGQVLKVTSLEKPAVNTVTYITHTVVSGDNLWNLSIKYGIPHYELRNANGLTDQSILRLGQTLRVPQHHIPVKELYGTYRTEALQWWSEAQYVFSIGKTAKITDIATGRSFYVKRTMGANHADSEPLTSQDAAIMKDIWGGTYSWRARGIIVEVDGRKLAASMHSFPHGTQEILNNGYNGHFCIHFIGSQRHNDGQIDQAHQTQINNVLGR